MKNKLLAKEHVRGFALGCLLAVIPAAGIITHGIRSEKIHAENLAEINKAASIFSSLSFSLSSKTLSSSSAVSRVIIVSFSI